MQPGSRLAAQGAADRPPGTWTEGTAQAAQATKKQKGQGTADTHRKPGQGRPVAAIGATGRYRGRHACTTRAHAGPVQWTEASTGVRGRNAELNVHGDVHALALGSDRSVRDTTPGTERGSQGAGQVRGQKSRQRPPAMPRGRPGLDRGALLHKAQARARTSATLAEQSTPRHKESERPALAAGAHACLDGGSEGSDGHDSHTETLTACGRCAITWKGAERHGAQAWRTSPEEAGGDSKPVLTPVGTGTLPDLPAGAPPGNSAVQVRHTAAWGTDAAPHGVACGQPGCDRAGGV